MNTKRRRFKAIKMESTSDRNVDDEFLSLLSSSLILKAPRNHETQNMISNTASDAMNLKTEPSTNRDADDEFMAVLGRSELPLSLCQGGENLAPSVVTGSALAVMPPLPLSSDIYTPKERNVQDQGRSSKAEAKIKKERRATVLLDDLPDHFTSLTSPGPVSASSASLRPLDLPSSPSVVLPQSLPQSQTLSTIVLLNTDTSISASQAGKNDGSAQDGSNVAPHDHFNNSTKQFPRRDKILRPLSEDTYGIYRLALDMHAFEEGEAGEQKGWDIIREECERLQAMMSVINRLRSKLEEHGGNELAFLQPLEKIKEMIQRIHSSAADLRARNLRRTQNVRHIANQSIAYSMGARTTHGSPFLAEAASYILNFDNGSLQPYTQAEEVCLSDYDLVGGASTSTPVSHT